MSKKESNYIKKRKSYYGFAKDYPGNLGSNKYVIGDSLTVRRKETIRKISRFYTEIANNSKSMEELAEVQSYYNIVEDKELKEIFNAFACSLSTILIS